MLDVLTDALVAISEGLLAPVIGALLILSLFTVYHAGVFAAELVPRLGRRRVARAQQSHAQHFARATRSANGSAESNQGVALEKYLDDQELLIERKLSWLQLGVRLGPVLGLAGTLIPLGPALSALGNGDIAALSSQLIVAFSTTVVGLMVGAVCFVLLSTRRAWYRQDFADLEHAFKQGDAVSATS